MPQFPRRKDALRQLSAQVVAGLQTFPADFPIGPFDWGTLAGLRAQDQINVTARQVAEAALTAAIDAENATLALIEEATHRQINLAESTYPGDTAQLQKIGWGTSPAAGAPPPIGQPRNLSATVQGKGEVSLDWNSPSVGRTAMRYYLIERQLRDINSNVVTEDWGAWQRTATVSEIEIQDMPRGVNITFRVSAVNSETTSPPSNSVDVVL